MNYCIANDELLDDVAAGDPVSSAFAAHLRGCVGCATELQRRRAVLERISAVAAAWMDSGLHHPQRGTNPGTLYAGAAMAAAFAVAAVILASFQIVHRPSPPAQSIVSWHSPTEALLKETHI